MKRSHGLVLVCMAVLAALVAAGTALAQVNAVDLAGVITDPQNAVVAGAKVTIKNLATNATRSVQTADDGRYLFVGVAPGRYELRVEKSGFTRAVNPEIILEIGRAPEINVQLTIQAGVQQVTVSAEAEIVETQRTAVSETVGSREIENLPINGRNYVNFTLINSQASRDSAPSIGAAPTSGLNFGGQRARSNEVSVDGADSVDNSINGIRSTVSQEAVQEFQLIISNYMPEFGRATGGVINIVTKSGSNQFHGDLFGFLRTKDIQARNPFSFAVNTTTGGVTPVKQAYTRAQYGTAFGGPIRKDKTFYFISFEGTRRHETGFTDIGDAGPRATGCPAVGLFGLTATGLTCTQALAVGGNPTGITGAGPFPAAAVLATYAALAGSASNVAVRGVDPGLILQAFTGAPMPVAGPRFSLPLPCPANTLVPIPCGASGQGFAPLPASFVALATLATSFPIVERTDLYSARLDQIWSSKNSTFLRANVSPSFLTGIEVNAQNQNFGQNAGSRNSTQHYRDWEFVAQHNTAFSGSLINEFRFQASRRGLHYGFSDCTALQCPTIGGSSDGGQTAVNITGFAFFGREPFSTVDRIERRFQWTDHLTYVTGKHTLKFGGDTNFIQVRSRKTQTFELDFGGVYNFGSLPSDALVNKLLSAQSMAMGGSAVTLTCTMPQASGSCLPDLNALQVYGLGLPTSLYQGVGNSNQPFDNKTLGLFAQDSWRISPRVTLNYGLRYDVEWSPLFTPFGGPAGLNAAAEKAVGVVEGIPHFDNGFQPRAAIAWDPWGDGKTVIRAGGGLFFDHPLLAISFDSTTADGARSSQLLAPFGLPSACGIFFTTPVCGGGADTPGNLNAATLFQGVLNTATPAGFPATLTIPYIAGTNQIAASGPFAGQFVNVGGQQRFNPKDPNSIFINQQFLGIGLPIQILPFTFPVAKDFKYGYATQGNLTLERDLGHSFKISVGYQYTKGTHLNRPRNANVADPILLVNNYRNAIAAGQLALSPKLIAAPSANIPATAMTCGVNVVVPGVLGVLTGCPGPLASLNTQFLATAAAFNFFRPSGPNPSFAVPGLLPYPALVALAASASYPKGYFNGATPVQVPWSDVDQQESTGNSTYHGLTVNLEKRFSQHYQLLASYTYSHAIDDSTDLQSLLTPQNDNAPQLERGNSTFDQRHRFVLSGVAESPYKWRDGGWKRLLADWVFAPLIEVSAGRPFNVLTGTNYNQNFCSSCNRPSFVRTGAPIPAGAVSATSPFIPGITFLTPTVCPQSAVTLPPNVSVPPAVLIAPPLGCDGNLGRNVFTRPKFASFDMRLARKFKLTERFSVEAIADMFNLLNRFNVGDVNPLCDPASACTAGQPTASLDPRTFQFGLKAYW